MSTLRKLCKAESWCTRLYKAESWCTCLPCESCTMSTLRKLHKALGGAFLSSCQLSSHIAKPALQSNCNILRLISSHDNHFVDLQHASFGILMLSWAFRSVLWDTVGHGRDLLDITDDDRNHPSMVHTYAALLGILQPRPSFSQHLRRRAEPISRGEDPSSKECEGFVDGFEGDYAKSRPGPQKKRHARSNTCLSTTASNIFATSSSKLRQ